MQDLSLFQAGLFLKKKYVMIYPHTEDVEISINRIVNYSKQNKDFLIYIHHEIIPSKEYFEKIENLVQSLPNQIWIMSSTASVHPIMVNPIVNTLMFKDLHFDSLKNGVYEIGFGENLYKTQMWGEKKIKSILSMNRRTEWRDMVFDKLKNTHIDIKRYCGLTNADTLPTWSELIDEYLNTYVSYVIETNYPTDTQFTPFTEKTILSFLCGNIPIILGKKNLIKELQAMGFWIPNQELGFGFADDMDEDELKIDRYVECINTVNRLKINEYYINNIHNINKNFEIISNIFSKKNKKMLG